eukprot:TRINITY_DN10184_c0_g1_i10.p1 TRINITY_DN10184_c0_g1~~TRINITY_DN10184_c0_g1_i10.p1  ORF type:complete len:229 (-),score=47.34 TRINITY_DN10184_c0_g1_i10:236-922(-)
MIKMVLATLLIEIFTMLRSLMDLIFKIILFLSCLFYLTSSHKSLFQHIMSVAPLEMITKKEIDESMDSSVKGIFVCSLKISIYHSIFTWMIFDILGLDLSFISALLAGVISLIPLVSPVLLCIPASLYLYFGEGRALTAIFLPIVYLIISNKVFNDIYEKQVVIHPYVTGLSVVFGVYAFNVSGVIYGPLVVCVMFNFYQAVFKNSGRTTKALVSYVRFQRSTPRNGI